MSIKYCYHLPWTGEEWIDLFRTTFSEFSSRHAKDERFRAIEKVRDREAYFHEYVQELKTRVKEGSNRPSSKEKVPSILPSTLRSTPISSLAQEGVLRLAARIESDVHVLLDGDEACR